MEDRVDAVEVFEMIRDINDPEHPLTLEQLRVVRLEDVHVEGQEVEVVFTPTIPHCSMATMIGLMIRNKLHNSLSPLLKVQVRLAPDSHVSQVALDKQLNDKERVFAAMENPSIQKVVARGIRNTDRPQSYILSL